MQIFLHHTNLDPNNLTFETFFGAALRNICNVNKFICHTFIEPTW